MYSGSSHSKSKAKSTKTFEKVTPSFGTIPQRPIDNPFLENQDVETSIAKTFANLKRSVDNMQIQDYKLHSNSSHVRNFEKENYASEKKVPESSYDYNARAIYDNKRLINRSFDAKTQSILNSANKYASSNLQQMGTHHAHTLGTSNKSLRSVEDANNNEIHIYLPEKTNQSLDQSRVVESSEIRTAINKLKSTYSSLKEKLSHKKKFKETDIKKDESELFLLQNNINEMNKLVEQVDDRKMMLKEKNLMVIIEKERKKFTKDREKIIQDSEQLIAKLKAELEKSNSIKKEVEIKLKMIEPLKFDLEKKLRALEMEKKALEFEFLKFQKDQAMIQAEVEKYKVLYNLKDKDYKLLLEKYDLIYKQKEALEEENRRFLPKIGKLEAENVFLKNDNERIISETQLKINELKREINDLNARIKALTLEISSYRTENESLKEELKEERMLKERIMIDKMNFESRMKELDLDNIALRRRIEELLRRPPQIVKEIAPPIEKIVEKPIDRTVMVDNPENIREIEFLKNRVYSLESEIASFRERLNCSEVELRDKEGEINHWKGQFQQLERRRFDEAEIRGNERTRVLEQENEDLKYRLRFLSEELKRQSDLNQEKNQNMGSQIRALNEKNLQLENMLQYYKYSR